jgi:hypothetical protein
MDDFGHPGKFPPWHRRGEKGPKTMRSGWRIYVFCPIDLNEWFFFEAIRK